MPIDTMASECCHITDAAGRVDPTGTTMLRKRYEHDMARRFRKVRVMARQALVRDETSARVFTPFSFVRPSERVTAFTDWFYDIAQEQILGIIPGTPSSLAVRDNWQGEYLQAAFDKGQRDALARLRVLQDIMQVDAPRRRRERLPTDTRVDIIKARSYTELEGITDEMARQISRHLSQGIAKGDPPERIARRIAASTDLSLTRARMLVRTEMIAAHAEASLSSYEEAGIDEVGVQAEFMTARDDVVCPTCRALEGEIMTVEEARGMIPVHPNCRCAWLPVL